MQELFLPTDLNFMMWKSHLIPISKSITPVLSLPTPNHAQYYFHHLNNAALPIILHLHRYIITCCTDTRQAFSGLFNPLLVQWLGMHQVQGRTYSSWTFYHQELDKWNLILGVGDNSRDTHPFVAANHSQDHRSGHMFHLHSDWMLLQLPSNSKKQAIAAAHSS